MRRLTLTGILIGMLLTLAVPLALAQTPPPATGPDGQPLTGPEYTPTPPTQTPLPTRTPTRSPSPCKCVEEAQIQPKPASWVSWWLILIPIFVIVMILMYRLGKITGGEGGGSRGGGDGPFPPEPTFTPEQFGATGGGESFPASAPGVIPD